MDVPVRVRVLAKVATADKPSALFFFGLHRLENTHTDTPRRKIKYMAVGKRIPVLVYPFLL